MVKKIKFIGKTRHNRRIKITFDDGQVNYVTPYCGWISLCDIHHDECREIAIQNIYWLLSLDLNVKEHYDFMSKNFDDITDEFTPEVFERINIAWLTKELEQRKHLFENEYEYLKENLIKDYFKNQDNYPSTVDIKKIYNLK